MISHASRAAALALAGACLCTAAAGAQGSHHGHHGTHPAPAAPPAPAPAGTDARRSYGPADIRFMQEMIGHHAQAITMSRMAAPNGATPQVQVLAERIINAQRDEIAAMQTWLRERGQPAPEVAEDGAVSGHAGGHEHHEMPGMLTQAQLRELAAARGAEFDRLFLEFMIRHHRGAISMVQDLFGTPGAAQDDTVFKIASEVNVDQITEIGRMQRMLASRLLGVPIQ